MIHLTSSLHPVAVVELGPSLLPKLTLFLSHIFCGWMVRLVFREQRWVGFQLPVLDRVVFPGQIRNPGYIFRKRGKILKHVWA